MVERPFLDVLSVIEQRKRAADMQWKARQIRDAAAAMYARAQQMVTLLGRIDS
jgi:hypothetical protein